MLKRPSARRKSQSQASADLPLVPIMDAFVTLIAFLIMATSLLSVTLIDTPVPIMAAMPDKDPKKPLALTLKISEEGLRLGSGFRLIPEQVIPKVDKDYNLEKLHQSLHEIKKQFVTEKTIVFMPSAGVKYEEIVKLMDASRKIEKTDESIYAKGEGDVTTVVTDLFPDVVFGNIVSGGN